MEGNLLKLTKVHMHLLSDPQIPLLGIYPEDTLLAIWKYMYSSVFIVILLLMGKYLKSVKCSIRKKSWINYVIYTQCSTLQLWIKNEEYFCGLKWNHLQDILSEKKCKSIFIVCAIVCIVSFPNSYVEVLTPSCDVLYRWDVWRWLDPGGRALMD